MRIRLSAKRSGAKISRCVALIAANFLPPVGFLAIASPRCYGLTIIISYVRTTTEATVSATKVSDKPAASDFDYRWQQVFAISGLVGVVLCLVAWEVFMPQPPDFTMSGPQTAQFYSSHQTGMLIGVTLSSLGMPFLIAWTIQLGAMLRRLEGGSGLVAIVATVGTISIPILLVYDVVVWAIAAYRPQDTTADVTRAFSDLGWISSMLIWPPLAAGMALTGVIIMKTRGQAGAFPAWLGWVTFILPRRPICSVPPIFFKKG